MKKVVFLIATFVTLAVAGQAQTIQKFFSKYSDDERFQYVCVSKGMMNMASVFGGMAKDEKKLMSKMNGLKILSLEGETNQAFLNSVISELEEIVEKGNYESAVEVRDKGERVNIYYRVTGTDNADMLIITKEKGEFNCIWISGKMSKEEMMHSFSSNSIMNEIDDFES